MVIEKPKKQQMKNVAVRLPADVVQWAKEEVEKSEGLTESDIYRQAIVEFFSRHSLQSVNGEKAS